MTDLIRQRCLAYLSNELSDEAKVEFESELASSPELQLYLERYSEVLGLEQVIASEQPALGSHFSVKVMEALEQAQVPVVSIGFIERYFSMSRKVMAPIAATCAVTLAVVASLAIRNDRGLEIGPIVETETRETFQSEGKELAVEVPKQLEVAPEPATQLPPAAKQEWLDGEAARKGVQAPVDITASIQGAPGEQSEKKAIRDSERALAQADADPSLGQQRTQSAETQYADLIDKFKSDIEQDRTNKDLNIGKRFGQIEEAFEASRGEDGLHAIAARGRRSGTPSSLSDQGGTAGGEALSRNDSERDEARFGSYLPPPTVVAPNTEDYGIYQENLRTRVAREPRSTFSVDVDTGSYTNMRRFLSMGQLPPPQSVRVEEFINYFSYSYPEQSEKPFAVHYEIAPSPFSPGRHLLKLGVSTKRPDANERKPWNLVFLIDVSGSMAQANKLPLLKRSFAVLLANLRNDDHVALVTYAGGARVVLPATAGANRELVSRALADLVASGGTNGSAGIDMAYAEAEKFKNPDSVNRVIVATDGDFNMGNSSFDGLMQLIEAKRRGGTTLTVLGFGEANLKEKTLEQLSDRGNGNYFYIDTFSEARKVFERQLAQNIEVVAKDVKLQVEFNPQQVLEYRLVGYDNRVLANDDFANDSVDAGEIGAGHSVTALYEIVLAGAEAGNLLDEDLRYVRPEPTPTVESDFSAELAFVKIRYKAPTSDSSSRMQFPIERSQVQATLANASTDFRFAASVAGFGQLLRESKYLDQANYASVESLAAGALGEDSSGERKQFVELVRNAKARR